MVEISIQYPENGSEKPVVVQKRLTFENRPVSFPASPQADQSDFQIDFDPLSDKIIHLFTPRQYKPLLSVGYNTRRSTEIPTSGGNITVTIDARSNLKRFLRISGKT